MKKAAKGTRQSRASAIKYPSKASLREMPERGAKSKTRKNKFAAQIAKDGGLAYQVDGESPQWMPLPQGRPKKGSETEPSKPRTVRLPDSVWQELQARAEARGVGVHTLLRELVAAYLGRAA